jgi:Fe-S cluster biosynthesis and repair protein YggX
MALFSSDKSKCTRCGRKTRRSVTRPVPTELGQRVSQEICADCWKEWLDKQKQLINHFGLDVSNPDSHDFLFRPDENFLFRRRRGTRAD